jgi:hypothetical protein
MCTWHMFAGLALELGGERSDAASAPIWKREFRREQEIRINDQKLLRIVYKFHFEQAVSVHHDSTIKTSEPGSST